MRLSHAFVALALLLIVLSATAWDAARIRQQAQALPAPARATLERLLRLVAEEREAPALAQLEQVNRFINTSFEWRDDQQVWGQPDYWAAPLEMLQKGAGDCEDFAMAKYFMLVGLGLPEASLRLVYVRAQWQGRPQAHMVLAWYPEPGAEPWILDNLNPELKRASQRADLQPVFSFNAQGLWQGSGAQSAGNPLTRLTIWRDALARARDEGFF